MNADSGHRECSSRVGLLLQRMMIKVTAVLFLCIPGAGSVLSVVAVPPMSKPVKSYAL